MRFILILSILILIPQAAIAEIVNCNGVWTNEPCDSEPNAKLEAVEASDDSIDQKLKSQKQAALHELRTLKFNLEHEHGGSFSIASAERVCSDSNSSLEDCESSVNIVETDLLNKQLTLSKLDKKQDKSNEEENSGDTVVIQQNNNYRIGLIDDEDSRGPTIIGGTEIPAGETVIGIEPKRDPSNTLIEQQRKPSRRRPKTR